MAKVARASLAAVQSAAEAQQIYPAIQQLLSTYSLASRHATPEDDVVATTLPAQGDLACSSNDNAASSVHRQYAGPPAEAMQQPMHQQDLPLRVWGAQAYAPAVGTFHQQRPSALSSRSSDLSTSSSSSGSSSSTTHRGSHSASAGTLSSKAGGQQMQSDPLTEALNRLHQSPKANKLTPSAIVEQLDKYIVGQPDAKRAVAVALRNRWRRHMLPSDLAEEITPKNILMIGPTGCGKTEIARRLAQLVSSPFIKVEATKFTELGFVGRDVDEIVKDLMEASLTLTKTRLAEALREVAEQAAEDIILAELIGSDTEKSIDTFRHFYRIGQLDGAKLELDLDALDISEQRGDMPQGFPFQALNAMMEMMAGRGPPSRGMPGRPGSKGTWKGTVAEARKLLTEGEIEKSLNSDRVVAEALRAAQQDGIVFIDEIDKIVETSRGVSGATSSNVSSEGVQRDLLPILEGSVVPTKYGNVSTDHVLFIASGAFHSSKPSDMLAELQGRLPVRVELAGLTAEDFYRILTEPQHNMIKQQQVLLATEGVDLVFTDGAIRAIAEAAHQANRLLDNIGARRLHTVVERVLAEISFSAPDKVAEAQQQNQQEAAQAAPSSSAGASGAITAGSSKGSKSKAARSGSRSKGKEVGSDITSSSVSRTKGPAMLHYVVTEDMVNSCMKEVLKQKDLSRYML